MPLAGSFDVLDFGEVLSLLSRRSATGRLQLRTAAMHGTIWLSEGRATAAEIGGSVGGESRNKWRNQIEDICFDALRSPRGSFEFHPEDQAVVPAGPRVRLETVLASGKKRLEIWQEVESVIHSFEAVPRLAENLVDDSLTLSQDTWRILTSIDGRRTVSALAKRLDIELLEFCQALEPMITSGAVVLDQPEGWLKSLPKVRLETHPGPGEIDPSTIIDPGSPDESLSVLNVSSTVVGNGGANHATNGSSARSLTPARGIEDSPPGKRRLRSRTRSRAAESN
jgi:hypothetical protein